MKEVVNEPKVVTESKPVDPPKESFFDNTIGEIFHRKNPKPKLPPKNLKSKSKVKVESKSNSDSPFTRFATATIGFVVVLGVGYVILNTVVNTPEVRQQLNATDIGGVSAYSLIIPGFALTAVAVLIIAVFGLSSVFGFGGSNGD